MMELKRVDPLSLAKITAVVMAILGFIIGVIVTVISLALGSLFLASGNSFPAANIFPGFGFIGIFAVIAFPILYGIMGFVFGAIWALIYNAIAAKVGGIMIDLKGSRISQSKR